jgi:hypothetical protein
MLLPQGDASALLCSLFPDTPLKAQLTVIATEYTVMFDLIVNIDFLQGG